MTDDEWVPLWIYKNGRRLGKDLWQIGGIKVHIEKTPFGHCWLVPEPMTFREKIKSLIQRLRG